MIFVYLGILIVGLIVFICVRKKGSYNVAIVLMPICIISILLGFVNASLSFVHYVFDDSRILDYKSTISTEEYNIDKYDEVKTATNNNETEKSYTYTIKNTDNCKTVSAKDNNVYSITASSSSSKVNHLTIKHNIYFNWATFTTTQKDDYIFSSK